MKFPEPKTWTEDKAMTVNPVSDNYKMGFNDAIREVKKLNEEAQSQSTPTMVKFDKKELTELIMERGFGLESFSGKDNAEYLADWIMEKFSTKSEPLVKLDEKKLSDFILELYKEGKVSLLYEGINILSKDICSKFGTKIEPSKEVTDNYLDRMTDLSFEDAIGNE